MLGPVGLSMAGIICMAPVLASGLEKVVGPISKAIHMDPSIWGSVLSMDMVGLNMGTILWNSLPVLLLALLLGIGVVKWPDSMTTGFRVFARVIQIISTVGLTLAAIRHMTGFEIVKGMPALLDAMRTVCSICIVMLGSMPLAELFQRLLRKPLELIRKKTGLSGTTTTALLPALVSAAPALAMIPDMEKRRKTVVSSFVVFGTGTFGAHLAFTINAEPDILPAMLAAKLIGGALTIVISMMATRNMKQVE